MKRIVYLLPLLAITLACSAQTKQEEQMSFSVKKSDAEWKKELSAEQYYVLREKGTERPHTSEYDMFFENGTYHCSACKAPLFESESKFDAHCGWPSFDQAINDSALVEQADRSHGMVRTEIMCGNCGGHLGHVFNDGPTETGLRYCVNGLSLGFDEEEVAKKEETKK